MTQGLKEGEPNGRDVYADIIDHPHWQSPARQHMSLYDRAAQFAAFDALAGYSDMVREEQRVTDTQIELGDNELENLNQKLTLISDVIEDGYRPELTITYFVPDELKAGGHYVEITDTVKKVDSIARKIILMSSRESGLNNTVDFDRIARITGDLVDYLDDEIGFEVTS